MNLCINIGAESNNAETPEGGPAIITYTVASVVHPERGVSMNALVDEDRLVTLC